MAGCRSTLSISKIKVKISETKFFSFYKTLIRVKKSIALLTLFLTGHFDGLMAAYKLRVTLLKDDEYLL